MVISINEERLSSWFEQTLEVIKVGKGSAEESGSETEFKRIWPEQANGANDNGVVTARSQKLMQHEPEESERRGHLQFATKERWLNSREEFEK